MKKVLLPLGVLLIVAGAAYFVYYLKKTTSETVIAATLQEEKPASAIPAPPANDLPALMPLTMLDSTQVVAQSLTGKTILVVFLPDCDHCQREAVQIRDHISDFKDYTLYFISSANLPEIKQFGEKYQLLGRSNILLAHTAQGYITNSFGYIPTPSMYIYSGGHLVKAFNGETPIGSILPAI